MYLRNMIFYHDKLFSLLNYENLNLKKNIQNNYFCIKIYGVIYLLLSTTFLTNYLYIINRYFLYSAFFFIIAQNL